MPKNPKLNIARYKVAGGDLNEFEFHQNQQAFVEQQQHNADNLIPGTPPEMQSESEEGSGGLGAAAAKVATRLPPKTRRQAATKKSAKPAKKAGKKSTKKSTKKTKPVKRSTASKGRPAKKAAKRSTKKAAKKTGTKKKARK